MAQRVEFLIGFALFLFLLWLWSRGSTPGGSGYRLLERFFGGIVLCYCLGRALLPLGIAVPGGPVASALAGALGLPGALLSCFLGAGAP